MNHPAAKSMIELSRAQDESVGDGTTSVVILAGEALQLSELMLDRGTHPTVVIAGYYRALEDAIDALGQVAVRIDPESRADMERVVASCLGTKFAHQWGPLFVGIAMDAVRIVRGPAPKDPQQRAEIDLKQYARVEKIPGGDVADTAVVRGCVINKDVTHAGMRRRIERPRVVLLDCNLEYKKGESQTAVECSTPEDFARLLKAEEEEIERMCADILRVKPDVVCTEKGVSDLAQHFLMRGGCSVLRRMRKTDNNRLARVTGATIAHRPDELQESDVGTRCNLFDIRKIGDEYFSFITSDEDNVDARACTIVIRGPNKDVMNEVERNLWDAMHVARNIALDPRLVPGGGASEMAVAQALTQRSKAIEGVRQLPYRNVALALEVIPRTLAQNCGADVIRLLTELRAKHAQDPAKNAAWGIDGVNGVIGDMNTVGVWEPFEVKAQTFKSAIEAACLLLRVDDVLSGSKKKGGSGGGAPTERDMEDAELQQPGMP